jgi:CSLREA domain-containing protein
MFKDCRRRCAHALWEGLAMVMLCMATAQAQNFTVDSTTDAVDAVLGNGICADASNICTLRAAIQEANALAGADTITLPAEVFQLSISGTGEELAATGDLDMRVILKLLFGLVIMVVPRAHRPWRRTHRSRSPSALEIAATGAGWPRLRSFAAALRANPGDLRR